MAQQDWNRAGPKYVIEVRKLSLAPHCLKKGYLFEKKLCEHFYGIVIKILIALKAYCGF